MTWFIGLAIRVLVNCC